MSYELIETVTVGAGGASSIEFTSIPQDGTDLVLKVSARQNTGGDLSQLNLNFNGVSTDHSYVQLFGNGTSVFSFSVSSNNVITVSTNSNTANTFSNNSIYVSNYASSVAKSYSVDNVTENNATTAVQDIVAGQWDNTSAITSIAVAVSGNNDLMQHTTASLYKITAS